MSTTDTTNEATTSDAPAKDEKNGRTVTLSMPRGFLAKLGPALTEMVSLEDAAENAAQALGFQRVAVGRFLSELSVLWLGKGHPAEMVQSRLLGVVETGTGRQYEWDSVNEWIGAAATEDTLPDSLHGVFATEGLRVISRVPQKSTKDGASDERIDFARSLVESGRTSNRAVRAANKERTTAKNGTTGKKEVVPATVAGRIIPDVAKGAKSVRRIFAKRGVTASEATAIALYCASVASIAKGDSEVYSIVFQDVLDAKHDAPKPAKKR